MACSIDMRCMSFGITYHSPLWEDIGWIKLQRICTSEACQFMMFVFDVAASIDDTEIVRHMYRPPRKRCIPGKST